MHRLLVIVLLVDLGGPMCASHAEETPQPFVLLSEFQVWADAASPDVFRKLNRQYLTDGRSHVFRLYPHYENFVWDRERMRHWVDEAVALHAFNLFCIGDDVRTAKGYLFTRDGINPELANVFFQTVAYAHAQHLMVAAEPVALPAVRDRAHFAAWLRSWLGHDIRESQRTDIIKLSLEWFGAYHFNPRMPIEVAAFMDACREVNPEVLVYLDSIGGPWRQPTPFHQWLLAKYPGMIVSHYLNTNQVEAFRAVGARNMMVQINPSELAGSGGQFFIYHDETVRFLKDAIGHRVRYLSLAGVNYGYNRYNYDLFLEVVRPHLKLVTSVSDLRASIVRDEISTPPSLANVQAWLEQRNAALRHQAEPKIPTNVAGRPACFASAPDGIEIRRLGAIADHTIGPRFSGAYTDPVRREPVRATFALDFGTVRTVRAISVTPCLHPDENAYVATDLRLETRRQNRWQPVPGGVITGNTSARVNVCFPPRSADAIRLVVLSERDDGNGNYRACCAELAYDNK